ncbi:polysaccharide pyruvyl transferase family protein [Tetragenococcus halophilus]|nr:polysaccharide pyruvyl transferase family protein [Tetragenococcus halophilus]
MGKSSQEYKKSILTYENLVRKVLSTNDKVILFVSSKEDEKAMLEVYKKFRNNPNVKVYDVNGLSDIRKLYNKIDLLIGTRMHSMIIAYTMYVPLVALSWQTKIDSMFTMIEEQENLFKLDNLERDLNKIKSTYLYQLDNLQLYERKRRKVLEKIKRKSRINNKILLEFKNNIG